MLLKLAAVVYLPKTPGYVSVCAVSAECIGLDVSHVCNSQYTHHNTNALIAGLPIILRERDKLWKPQLANIARGKCVRMNRAKSDAMWRYVLCL